MIITQLINTRGNAVANQFIKTKGNITIFQSYNSNIIEIDENNKSINFGRYYSYSNTTIRHRNKFLSDYLGMEIKTKDIDKMLHDGTFDEYTVNYNENL